MEAGGHKTGPVVEFPLTADKSGSYEDIVVDVVSKSAKGEQIGSSQQRIRLTVVGKDMVFASLANFKSSIEGFIPQSIRSVFNVFATLSLAVLVMVLMFGFIGYKGQRG